MKRIISFLLSFIIAFSFCSVAGAASHSFYGEKKIKIQGVTFKYRILEDKYCEILEGDNFIPESIKGYPVVSIASFAYGSYIDEYEAEGYAWKIPETVKYIGDSAFRSNSKIKTIDIPDSVAYIGTAAFKDCSNLKKVKIPSLIRRINSNTFDNCSSLEKVTLNNMIEYINDEAFFNCRSLKTINMPQDLLNIGMAAFYGCKSLKKLDFTNCKFAKIGGGPHTLGEYDDASYFWGTYTPYAKMKKITGFKIITNPTNDVLMNSIEFKFNANVIVNLTDDSKSFRCIPSGGTFYIRKDYKKLTDIKSNKPNVLKVTKDGKAFSLKKGTAVISATMQNGKKLRTSILVQKDPVLSRKGKEISAVSVKKGNTVSVRLSGRVASIKNVYTSSSKARIVSKAASNVIKIKGVKSGVSTVKIKVNGVKTLRIKVNVK